MLLYRIADPGEGFDISGSRTPRSRIPTRSARPRPRPGSDGLRPGGLGLVMTRAFVDDVIYNEKRNEVVLVKYLD